MYCFPLGIYLAQIYKAGWSLPKEFKALKWGVFVTVLMIILLSFNHRLAVFGLFLFVLFSFSGNRFIRRIVTNKFLVHIGVYCYGMYFFHFLILRFASNFLPITIFDSKLIVFILLMPIVVGLTYLVAKLIYHYIEIPFIKLARDIIEKIENRKN
jgi:peptidoglycan/LPS O-acetylase OafA/YrhL